MGWLQRRREMKHEEAISLGGSDRAEQDDGRTAPPDPDGTVITNALPGEPEQPPGTREQRMALIREATSRAAAKGKFVGDPVAELDQIARERTIDPGLLAFIRDKLATDQRILGAYPNAEAAVAIRAARAAERKRTEKREQARPAEEGSGQPESDGVPFTWALQMSVDKAVDSSGWRMIPSADGGVITGTFNRGGDTPRDWTEAGPVFLRHVLEQSESPKGPFYRLVIWEGTIPAAELDTGRSMAIIYDT